MRNSTTYKLGGPKTFRRSSSKILNRWGSNLQNIEKSMRSVYIPDGFSEELKGRCEYFLETGDLTVFTEEELVTLRVFVNRDQSGAEALIVAYECDPKDYRKIFIYKVSPHVYLALKLFTDVWKSKIHEKRVDVTEDDVDRLCMTPIEKLDLNPAWKPLARLIKSSDDWPTSERYYYFSKQTIHSGNYDIQGPMFIMNVLEKSGGKVVIPLEEGKRFLETYRGLFPEIPERNNRIRRQVDTTKVLYNLFGFPYQITNYNITEATYKEYYAWSAQSTVGEITRIAVSSLQEYIEANHLPWDFLQDNHDSYLSQCPLIDVKKCSEMKKTFMNQELTSPVDGVKFRMQSDCQVGFNWSPYKLGVNNLGLREIKWI